MQANQPPIRDLSEGEVNRYIDTLRALAKAGVDAEKNLGTDPSQLTKASAAQHYSSEILGVLESHGLDQQSFSDIHWNMISAWAALEINKNKKKMDQSRAKQEASMAAMKSHLSPEQYRAMMEGMKSMNAYMDAYENIPEENLELARKNRGVLDEINRSGKR